MPLYSLDRVNIGVKELFRSSGISPVKAEKKGGALLSIGEKTLEKGLKLIKPKIFYKILSVEAVHNRGMLISSSNSGRNDPFSFGGVFLSKEIPQAEKLVVILMTLGPYLETEAIRLTKTSAIEGYMMDCLGSASLRYVSNTVWAYFEKLYLPEGLEVSHPYDPGMEGWPVQVGQQEVFDVFSEEETGVILNEYFMMIPKKSMTMVLGVGRGFKSTRRSCSTCSSQYNCIYRKLNDENNRS